MEQSTKNKKKRRKNFLDETKTITVEEVLEERIIKAFQKHVGKEKSISATELFSKIFNKHPEQIEFYQRSFLWTLVLKKLHKLRKSSTLFVINKGDYLFVLKTQEESDEFRNRMNKTIRALERTQDNADDWVNENKWRRFE